MNETSISNELLKQMSADLISVIEEPIIEELSTETKVKKSI